ncbi:MAG: chemotaxis protein CheD [Chthoniobacteraceae bacterium]
MTALSLKAPAPEIVETHYLHPAMIFTTTRPHLVTTVLGTCVAVCLWDRVERIGGINHFMLPFWNGAGLASPKFGNIAVPRLIEQLEKYGCKRANLIAKVFGGKSADDDHALLNIGARNAELAETMLAEACISVTARSLGGPFGRKLSFNTATSEVLLKRHAM